MGFPAGRRGAPGSAAARASANPIDAVAAHLRTYHDGHYMVLNISEESYDYAKFGDNVRSRRGLRRGRVAATPRFRCG